MNLLFVKDPNQYLKDIDSESKNFISHFKIGSFYNISNNKLYKRLMLSFGTKLFKK